MEVDAVQNNGLVNCIEEQPDEQTLYPESSDGYNVFGDPDIFPRVGEQYQTEIPLLIPKLCYCQKNSYDAKSKQGTFNDFKVGLPIPIIWIKDACKPLGIPNKIVFSRKECIQQTQTGLDYNESHPKSDANNRTLVMSEKLGGSGNSSVQQEMRIETLVEHKGKGHHLVPGLSSDRWNDTEEASFVLGLYIYGKNLVQVKKFIGSKKMGDILSFYYGKFYRSDKYRRWSECRKMRSKKCIYGQKIFTGSRQQELLSRLLASLSEECGNQLLEVSKTFSEGKMPLEDYVSTLKDSVGLNALVEAVGVGKGKEDLTGPIVDSMKSTHALYARPEIPAGRACSTLTTAEIITFLTGDFRLSKARSNDLFWEAVWPRLLARGWRSEQPRCYNYVVASRNSLVFLVPGVKKFSRKLVKGNHYFDSVSDVLGKVASDPELIELEKVEDNECGSKEGNGWIKETKSDRENSPDQQRHCYLKPRTANINHSTYIIKFTVVDTSLAAEKMTNVRETRTLPVGVLKDFKSESDSENNEDKSDDETNESDAVNTICFDRMKTDIIEDNKVNSGRGFSSDMNDTEKDSSKVQLLESGSGSTDLSTASKEQKKTDLLDNTHRKNATKCQSSRRVVPDDRNVPVPVTKKRRRLTACSRAERSCNTANIFGAPNVKGEGDIFCPGCPKSSKNVLLQEKPPQENKMSALTPPQENKTSADHPSNASSTIIIREAVPTICSSGTKNQHEKPQTRTMIDLNVPVSTEGEADGIFMTQMTEREQTHTRKESDDPVAGTPAENSEHHPEMNASAANYEQQLESETDSRRRSTRNRPLTTKALEAFAYVLDRKEKRKSRDNPSDNPKSRPSRRARAQLAGETSSSSGADFHKEEGPNVVLNSNGNGNVTPPSFNSG